MSNLLAYSSTCRLQLTAAVVPIQLRVLLDESRDHVARTIVPSFDNWKDLWTSLRPNQNIKMTQPEEKRITDDLVKKFDKLSPEAMRYLCSNTSHTQTQGNDAAHHATKEEIRAAIMTQAADKEKYTSIRTIQTRLWLRLVLLPHCNT
jgi:hypothetical protein